MNATFNHFEKLDVAWISRINAGTISRFEARLRKDGVGESTIRTYLKHLKAALSWAQEMGLLAEAPKIKLPERARSKSKMKGRPITGEEFDRMIAAVPKVVLTGPEPKSDRAKSRRAERDAALVRSWERYLRGLWLSGLRLGESLALSWESDAEFAVDLSGKYPRFRILAEGQKSRRDELLPMTPDFAEWLLNTPESERADAVFPLIGRHGRPLTVNAVGRLVSAIGEQAGVIVDKAAGKYATAHDLRRSFGTRWSKRHRPAILQKLMRHADIKTTMDYYVDQDADDIAADLWAEHRPTRRATPNGRPRQGFAQEERSTP